jgi:WhiB family redox-sensing transcriptional regulator
MTLHVAPLDSAALPCASADPQLWFAEAPSSVEEAKALCVPCPLRQACLAGALERREPWGVWGGQLVISGVIVPRKRPRAVPARSTSRRSSCRARASGDGAPLAEQHRRKVDAGPP